MKLSSNIKRISPAHANLNGGVRMEPKKYTEAGTDIEEVKRLNAASGLSYNDVKALLAQKSEGQTTDEMPHRPLHENLEVDSSTYKINQVPGNMYLDRNGPS